jgi:hypothetical protein
MVEDSTGKLTYAPNNLLTNSNTFTSWSANNVSLVAGQSDSDGGNNATFLKTASGDAYHYISLAYGLNPTKYIFSIEAEANGYSFLQLGTAGDDTRQATFDLATGIVGIAGSNTVATITSLGSGRYRCSIAVTTTDFTWILTIGVCNTSTWSNFNADGVSGVNIYKASIAAVTYETSPRSADQVITGGSAYYGPRFDHAWNGSAWVATGLLIEEQRTNLCTYSTNLMGAGWTTGGATVASGIADLSGGTTGVTLTADAGTSRHNISNTLSASLTSGSTYTLTFYLKQGTAPYTVFGEMNGSNWLWGSINWSDLSLATSGTDSATITKRDMGNGVYAVSLTWVRDATRAATVSVSPSPYSAVTVGNNDYSSGALATQTAIVLGCQLEAGSFPTSLIPTTTAAVTRSADIPSSSSPLTGYLAAGPSVWEFQDEATGTIARTAYAAGAFDWPVNKWYRSMGVYAAGTDTSSHMTVGSAY